MDEENTILESEVKGQRFFVSQFTHSLDPKRRLTIPSAWRAQVGDPKSLYVLPDVHKKFLRVFPAASMGPRLQKMMGYSIADSKARQFARVIAARSDLVSWDSQGRIRIKDELLEFAGLTGDVVMAGAIDSFELWNPDYYAKEAGSMDDPSFLDAAKHADL